MYVKNQAGNLLPMLHVLHPGLSMAQLKKQPVAIYGAYFDESGIAFEEDACAIAGFVGSGASLNRLAKNWTSVLRKYAVTEFHALEFYRPPHEVKKSTANPYREWSQTKRKKFIEELIEAISKSQVRLQGIGIDAVAFRSRTLEERRWLTGGVMHPLSSKQKWVFAGKPSTPYHYLFRVIVEKCVKVIPAKNAQLNLVMSQQDQFRANSLQLYAAMKVSFPDYQEVLSGALSFASPREFPQLQAADLVVYHLRKVTSERRTLPALPPKGILSKIIRLARAATDVEMVSAEAIEGHAARLPIRLKVNRQLQKEAAEQRAADRAALARSKK